MPPGVAVYRNAAVLVLLAGLIYVLFFKSNTSELNS